MCASLHRRMCVQAGGACVTLAVLISYSSHLCVYRQA